MRANGIVLRDPNAWYYKADSFLKKEVMLHYIEDSIGVQHCR
jgi:hypothetical protein